MELDEPQKNGNVQGKQSLRLQVLELNRVQPYIIELITREIDVNSRDSTQDDDIQIIETDNPTQNGHNARVKVVVEGLWTQGRLAKNSIIHLVNPSYDKATEVYSVNNSSGLLVIEPDNLLTCTMVASSLFCERKTWLNHVFLGQVGTNRAMLVGTLVHEVFQYGIKNKIADKDKLIKFLDELLDDATIMLEIYSVELHLKDVRQEALDYLNSVKEWIEKYMLAGPRYPLTNDSNTEVKILKICDIEENVWSTKYGLKGKIDATGSVRVYDRTTRTIKDKTLPLELKTGNPNLSASHAAQVSMYSMMIEDRYAETNQGLVIYLKEKAAMHNVPLTHNIKRDLVQRRNQINYHMKSYYFGPEMLNQSRMCKNCERLPECILMSKIYKPGELESYTSMKQLESEAVGHLDEKFTQFFKTYHEKLSALMSQTGTLDGDGGMKSTGSFWTYSSQEAEQRGTGFGKLQADLSKSSAGMVTFKRHSDHKENLAKNGDSSHPSSQPSMKKLKIDDYFKPKKMDGPKMRPFNVEANLSRCRIAISLDEDTSSLDSQNSSTAIAIGFMHELKEDQFTLKIYEGAAHTIKSGPMYRIDKIEKKTNLDIERIVLIRLLERENWRCDRIRQLLLDKNYLPSENIDLNLSVLSANLEELTELDEKYQNIVVEMISTDNYYILNEKSLADESKINSIVSTLTRVICSLDRTCLVVAHNLDHLMDLMRILQKNRVKFILIDDGKSNKARFQYPGNLVKVPQSDNMDLEKKFETYIRQHELAPVVISTYAMSIGGLQFSRRTFDYCVAYDCDTTELLVSLAPMFSSDRHIIIDVMEHQTDATSKADDVNGGASAPTAAAAVASVASAADIITLGSHLRSLGRH